MAATLKVKPVPEVMTEMKKETVIRTMQKDIDSLRGHIAKESVIKEVRKAPQEKKKDSLIKRIILRFRKSEETLLKEKERKKDEEQKFIEEQKQKEEHKKIREEQQKIAEERKKAEKKTVVQKEKNNLPKLIVSALAIILILISTGGVLYWWNYVRTVVPPVIATYYQCQDFQCVSVEGEGVDQCQMSQDCQPTEPDIPQSLIPTSGTELIVLEAGYEDAFIQELKLILAKEKEEGALESILIKITSQTEIRYASLSDFISFLGINLPTEIIQSNYTFFSYRQPEGARLGLVIQLKEGADLSETLNLWETNIQEDLKALFIGLNEQDVLTAATEEFQDNTYNEIAIRYLNFPSSDLSIDYAVVDDKLIIATSKKSMYAAINALMPIEYE